MKKWILLLVSGSCIFTGIFLAYGKTATSSTVETVRVSKGDIVDVVKATGRVEAVEDFIVRSKVHGRIEEVLKEEGEQVRAGEDLIRFDSTESEDSLKKARLKLEQTENDILESKSKLDASDKVHADPHELELHLKTKERQLSQNQINKESAERELHIARELYKIQTESLINLKAKTERFKKAEMEVLQAQGELEEARMLFSIKEKTRINLTTIKYEHEKQKRLGQLAEAELHMEAVLHKRLRLVSPINGTVISKDVKKGMSVPAGEPLMTVANLDRLKVRVEVDEVDAGRIMTGQEAVITFDSFADRKFRGHVDRIAPKALIKGERTIVEVIILIDEKTNLLRISNQVDVKIVLEKKENILNLPLTAVHQGSPSFVWLYQEGRARKAGIKTGVSDLESIEIISGLRSGDVIIAGNADLKDGGKVNIR